MLTQTNTLYVAAQLIHPGLSLTENRTGTVRFPYSTVLARTYGGDERAV